MEHVYGDGHYLVEVVPNLGTYGNNAYILSGPDRHAVTLIDAPEGAEAILAAIGRRTIERIIVTHAHFDHWLGFDVLRAATDAPVYAGTHETDLDASRSILPLAHDVDVNIGGMHAQVLHTPGHTPGSICLRFGEVVISGDTLFLGGPGRTRDHNALQQVIASITTHLYVMPPDTIVLPGHGEPTTIGRSAEEYAVFAAKPHSPLLHGDVLWLES